MSESGVKSPPGAGAEQDDLGWVDRLANGAGRRRRLSDREADGLGALAWLHPPSDKDKL